MYPYNFKCGQTIQTDIENVEADRAFIAHVQFTAEQAAAADTDGVHAAVACTTPAVGATCVVEAASAATDILTVSAPAALGDTANDLSILLVTAEDDTLAVSADDETGVITIALAKTTASKNTAALIQAAIRAIEGGTVAGVAITAFTCAAGGNWNTAAVATGETEAVAFTGGQTAAADVVTTGITNPPCARNVTATAGGGTAGDIKAIQVTVKGKRGGVAITETLPAFTANTPGTVVGNKAFDEIDEITIPAHDGTGATTAIGFGDKLGLPYKLAHDTVQAAYLNNVLESTAPTVAVSASAVENNTVDLNSALDGHAVDVYLIV